MAFCNNCRNQVQDGLERCPICGMNMDANTQQPPPPYQQQPPPPPQYQPPPPPPQQFQQQPPPPQQYQQQPPPPPQYQQPPPPPQQYQQQPPPQQYQQQQQGYPPQYGYGAPQQDNTKMMSIFAYICCLVPLIAGTYKTNHFVKYHTNQGIILWIITVAYAIIGIVLTVAVKVETVLTRNVFGVSVPYGYGYGTPGWLLAILWLLALPIVGACILGILNAVNLRMKPLPVVGNFTILK